MKRSKIIEKLLGRQKNAGFREEDLEDLDAVERDMIRGIVELSETTVKEVMVPRIDVKFIETDMDFDEMINTIIESGHSRFPVFKNTIDNVVGILYVKDLLGYYRKNQEMNTEKIMRKAYFVPESKRLDGLLREFKLKRVHIAISVDEYGGVSGIVCLEDIIEQIVGEIQDEFDNESEDIVTVGEGVYLCDARVGIEDLNEQLGLHLPTDDFDTLGGFVFDLFGKIPVKFEKVSHGPLSFIIQDMDSHKIKTIKVVKEPDKQHAS
ncbi:MAG: HlyC/CorC family transporter [Spirochaetales bacterium]|nr:MAG: HlyC/CorC family transporter [Spirochaetales bacterium]